LFVGDLAICEPPLPIPNRIVKAYSPDEHFTGK